MQVYSKIRIVWNTGAVMIPIIFDNFYTGKVATLFWNNAINSSLSIAFTQYVATKHHWPFVRWVYQWPMHGFPSQKASNGKACPCYEVFVNWNHNIRKYYFWWTWFKYSIDGNLVEISSILELDNLRWKRIVVYQNRWVIIPLRVSLNVYFSIADEATITSKHDIIIIDLGGVCKQFTRLVNLDARNPCTLSTKIWLLYNDTPMRRRCSDIDHDDVVK